ncbi:MAG: ATP-binding protein [Thermoanaerobaculia bacterium]
MVHPPWDFVLVAGIALAATIAVARRAGLRRSRNLAWVLLVVVLASGWFYVEAAGARAAADLERLVSAMAPTYAGELERMGHQRIGLQTPLDDPGYLAMIEAEKRWLAANRNVSDIYTFRRLANGVVALVVDSETDYDRDGKYSDGRESRTAIGEPYPNRIPALERAFADEVAFERNPLTDRWGTWISSFTPMHDDAGRVEAVLGVDYDAFLWVKAIARSRLDALAVVSAVLAVILTGLVSVARLRRAAAEAELRSSELAAARDAALAASRTKSQFLASVSHELRTPLHVFLGMNELVLSSDCLDEKQRRHAATAQRSAEGLVAMVDDLLDFAQLEAGRAAIEEETFPLAALLLAGAERHRVAADHKKLRFEIDNGIDDDLQVTGDGRRLRQILRHIIGNAVKFTDTGAVRVRFCVRRVVYGKVELEAEVSDTGIGIASDQRGAVFQQFSQIDPSNTRRYGGTGIGLALSRKLAEQMGGTIDFESELERGSVFRLSLPLRAAPTSSADRRPSSPLQEG